jgi:probable selenium-dependent hydroxylase accessory protein YqeC
MGSAQSVLKCLKLEKPRNLQPATCNMDVKEGSLIEALAIDAPEHIAIVGAGGKTALLFAIAEELRKSGKRVITSTTTKVWHDQAALAPCVVFTEGESFWKEKLKEGLAKEGHVFLGRTILETGKVGGINPSILDGLFSEQTVEYQLVEADGAAGLPVKAPTKHEPVIPASATLVVAMIGIEAIGRRLVPEEVFRPEAVGAITGLQHEDVLTSKALARLFSDPQGLFKRTPASARRIAFLNKMDLVGNEGEAMNLAEEILGGSDRKVGRVVLGSVKEGKYRVIRKE